MIVGSLLLILVAVALLVVGLVSGSSGLLVASIGASLLAAVALVVGARRVVAARGADPSSGPAHRSGTGQGDPAATATSDARGAGGPTVPTQFTPSTDGSGGGSGWRRPAGSSDAEAESPGEPAPDDPAPPDDEPGIQQVSPADAARVARLDTEVLVVDGRPRYHLADCAHLPGREVEPLPVAEAVELGFTPCANCQPDTALLGDPTRS